VIGDVSGVNCLEPSLALFGFAVMGVTQGIGAIFLVAGLPSHAELVEPDPDEQKDKQRASVRLVPLTFANGGGLGLSGRF
jgi:hypothetical protein